MYGKYNTDRYLENFSTKELIVLMCTMYTEKAKSFVQHLNNAAYIRDIQKEFKVYRNISQTMFDEWVQRYIAGDLN